MLASVIAIVTKGWTKRDDAFIVNAAIIIINTMDVYTWGKQV